MIRNITATVCCIAALSSCASYAGRAPTEFGVRQNAESGILRLQNMSRELDEQYNSVHMRNVTVHSVMQCRCAAEMLGNIAKTISQESKDNPEYRDDLNRIGKKLRAADSIADGLSVIADRIGETRTSSRRSGVDDIRRAIANELQSPAPTLQYVEWLCNECLDELAEVGSRIGCGSGISGYDDNRELSPIQPVIIHAVDINDADRRDTQIVHLKTKTLQQVASVINELKTYDMSQGMAGRQIICERLAIDTGRAMLAFEYVDGVDQTKVRELQNTVLKIIELSTQYARPTGGIFNRIGCWFKNRRITSEINSASAVANRLMAVIAIDWNNLNREQ